ncbi:hypothetical protein DYQ86_27095 [Acidobacteria bacterium AB60]|nr:hypothetical protein DYQ86_27095 [Acidobacteria bacterium AB60]
MKNSCLFLFLGFALGSATACRAQALACPDTVDVRQELATTVSGWEPISSDTPLRLSYVTFYDGPPKDKQSLVNDSSKTVAGRETATWKFQPGGDRHIWLACSYAGTNIALAKELPSTVSSCSVTYNPRQRVAGMPVIEKMVCK